jgi:transcriptional regulator with XRE-family HTH domain
MAKVPKKLSEKVKYYRTQRKLYQVELADIVGVSTGYIGSIEQGVRTPSLKLLQKLARALKISPKDLLS